MLAASTLVEAASLIDSTKLANELKDACSNSQKKLDCAIEYMTSRCKENDATLCFMVAEGDNNYLYHIENIGTVNRIAKKATQAEK